MYDETPRKATNTGTVGARYTRGMGSLYNCRGVIAARAARQSDVRFPCVSRGFGSFKEETWGGSYL